MEMERVFRSDFSPANKSFMVRSGDKVTILEIRKPNIEISVNNRTYTLPYRDFIVVTKQKNLGERQS